MAKESKKDRVAAFVDTLTVDQQSKVMELLGRVMSIKTLNSFFTKAFKKTLAISSRKGKGRNCQKWVAEKISSLLNIPQGKDEEIQSREMGQSGADVRMSARVLNLFSYGIECKDDASWNIKKAIQQAIANTKPGMNWVVFHRQTDRDSDERIGMVAIISAIHFFELLQTIKLLKNPPKLMRRNKV